MVGVVEKISARALLEAILGGYPLQTPSDEAVYDRVDRLNWREREVIRMRYVIPAMTGGKTPTLAVVGSIFKITRERVRQIETRAMKKLFPECARDIKAPKGP